MSNRVTVKSKDDICRMREAGAIVRETLKLIGDAVCVGISTQELDEIAHSFIIKSGATPSFLNYNGFPKSICTSVNEQVVHGIPGNRKLLEGDIISVDVGAQIHGFHGDAARTFFVGSVAPEVENLVKVTEECFFEAMKQAVAGNRVSDISRAVEAHAHAHGYGVVTSLIGHGIGRNLHEAPDVPNYYIPQMGRGLKLLPGMTLAVEPMINLGGYRVLQLHDGWTIVTADNKPSAHYENTIVITDEEPIILTL